MKFLYYTLISLFFASCSSTNSHPEFDVNKDNLKETVNYLSSPELKGRLAGSEGHALAADYAISKLTSYGISPKGTDGFNQFFDIEYNEINRCNFTILKDDAKNGYKLGTDYICRGFSGSGQVSSKVVFCGYGLNETSIDYNEYKNVDVSGKIVMIFKFNPTWKINNHKWENVSVREKVKIAVQHGAAGVIFVSKPNDKFPQPVIGSLAHGEGVHHTNIPQMQIDLPLANEILSDDGITLKALQTKIDQAKNSQSFELKTAVNMFVDASYEPKKRARNIIAYIEGSDSKLKNQYIAISAHLDHVGSQGNEVYYPGANDDASGSAAILEIARFMKENKLKPKKSILFILFDAEEQGMYGSNFFVENPTVKLEDIVTLINFDCVAYGDSVMIGGGKSVPGMWNLAKNIDKENTNILVKNTWYGGGADAESFFRKNVPTLYFATTNSYRHLHMPSDLPETLNYELFKELVDLGAEVTWHMANAKSRPAIIPKK